MNDVQTATQAPLVLPNIPQNLFDMKEFNFSFRKDELGNKRPSFKLSLPVPTNPHGIVAIVENEKQRAFVLELIEDAIFRAAREQVGDDVKPVNSQAELDVNKLTIEYLANLPKAERRGSGITKEMWDAFSKDYAEVMPGLTGKTAEQIGNALKVLTSKFGLVKSNKKIITMMKEQLALWFTSTKNAEEHSDIYELLTGKADALLAADTEALLANL